MREGGGESLTLFLPLTLVLESNRRSSFRRSCNEVWSTALIPEQDSLYKCKKERNESSVVCLIRYCYVFCMRYVALPCAALRRPALRCHALRRPALSRCCEVL